MVKTIDTLIEDVDTLLVEGIEWTNENEEKLKGLANNIVDLFKTKLSKKARQGKTHLRMSNIGSPCSRKLYLQIKGVEDEEPLDAQAYLKFLYGDLIEEMMLFLADVSGHTVEGRQDTQIIEGIKGHRDAVIDGVIVDVKSASSYSYTKFSEGKLEEDDAFGYIPQIQSYLYAAKTMDDPAVTDRSRVAFWAVDKTLGKHCLDFHQDKGWDFSTAYKQRIEEMNAPEPPERAFEPVPDGKSGNMKLDTFCSYCSVKSACYDGNIRTFLSSRGPVFLTTVAREPKMAEKMPDGSIKSNA